MDLAGVLGQPAIGARHRAHRHADVHRGQREQRVVDRVVRQHDHRLPVRQRQVEQALRDAADLLARLRVAQLAPARRCRRARPETAPAAWSRAQCSSQSPMQRRTAATAPGGAARSRRRRARSARRAAAPATAGSSNKDIVDMGISPGALHAEVTVQLGAVAQLLGSSSRDHLALLQHHQRIGVRDHLAVVAIDDQRGDAGLRGCARSRARSRPRPAAPGPRWLRRG